MRASWVLFMGGIVAFLPVAIIYTVWTHITLGAIEPVGAVTLFLLCGMCGMVGFYLRSTSKKLDLGPSDQPGAEIALGEGEYGFFSPYSWWPLPLAIGAACLFAGLALGWWVFAVGVVIGALSLVGWVFEYFRGDVV